MNISRKTTSSAGRKLANTDRQTAIKETKTKITASNLIRWAGLSAVVAGVLFVITILIHPENDGDATVLVARVWAIAHYVALGYSVFGLLGITGIYARVVEPAGRLGLAGFLMFYVALVLYAVFTFFEASILPELASEAPQFVEEFFGLLAGSASARSLGPLETMLPFGLLLHPVGSLLFGVAIFRTGKQLRWPAIVFTVGTVAVLASTALGEMVGRSGGAVAALGLAWLGYALWSEKPASEKSEINEAAAVPS
jgi:hypothetical protein